MNFIDEALLEIKAGSGGSGCLSFRRENISPREVLMEGMVEEVETFSLKLIRT